MLQRKTVLVVQYTRLPQAVRDELSDWHLFGNDRLLHLRTSYRLGSGPQTPLHMLQEDNFKTLYDAVVRDEGFKGSFDDFLGRYGLRTLHWVTCQKPDLTGVEDVLLDVCW